MSCFLKGIARTLEIAITVLSVLASTSLISAITANNSRASESPKSSSLNWGSWEKARGFYDSGKYAEALQELMSNPSESAFYFYNIGNVYFRMGKFGEAVAYFEKADSIKPHDADIKHNLSTTRTALVQVLGKTKLDPASSWLEAVADNIPLDEVRGILGIFAFITVLLWLRPYMRTRSIRKTLIHPAGLIGLMAFALSLSLYAAQRYASLQPPAYCIEKQVIRSGPGKNFPDLTTVEPGTKLRVTGPTATDASTQLSWHQIRFGEEAVGWIPSSSLLLL